MFDTSFDALIPLGWSPRVQALFFEFDAPDITPGRVTRVERDTCVVGSPFGTVVARAQELPAVGDWVALRTLGSDVFVEAKAATASPTRLVRSTTSQGHVASPTARTRPSPVARCSQQSRTDASAPNA
jgi:hypothetical protein